MSYNISLLDPVTKDTLMLDEPHQFIGDLYIAAGCVLWLNVTWNYASHFYRLLGEKGIRVIYGMTGAESIPVLQKAADQLQDDVDRDYWQATEGNAKRALLNLIEMAKLRPDGIWSGN